MSEPVKAPSLVRLYLLRLCYLLLLVGLGLQYVPLLFGEVAQMPVMNGVVIAMLCALALAAGIGLFAPLMMLPVLLWEILWKVIWALSVALPRWQGGQFDAEVAGVTFAVAFIIPFILIFPWRYFITTTAANLSRWR